MNKSAAFEALCKNNPPKDRVLFRPILMHFAARQAGKSYAQFASDYKTLVACNLAAMEKFDLDMVGLISDPYRETSAFGARVSFPAEAVPVCHDPIVSSTEDLKNLKNPDVYQAPRTKDRILGARLFQNILKGEVPVIGWIEGPLAEACDLAGISNMLMQLMTNTDFTEQLMDICMVTAIDFAKAQIDEGCSIIGIGDAICSQIDPETYRDLVFPRHRELIQQIHTVGAKVKLHICGNITHLLPDIAQLDVDILDIDYQVDLKNAANILGPEVICCGNINPVLIEDRSEKEIYNAVKMLVNDEKSHKFILSAGCEITVNTPPENLMAMRKASLF